MQCVVMRTAEPDDIQRLRVVRVVRLDRCFATTGMLARLLLHLASAQVDAQCRARFSLGVVLPAVFPFRPPLPHLCCVAAGAGSPRVRSINFTPGYWARPRAMVSHDSSFYCFTGNVEQ